jgi:hypothetical protein
VYVSKSLAADHCIDIACANVVVGVEAYKNKVAFNYPRIQLLFEIFDEGSARVAVVF